MRTCLLAVDVQVKYLDGNTNIIHPLELVAQDVDLVIACRRVDGGLINAKIRKLANFTTTRGKEGPAYSAFDGGTLRPAHTLEELLKDNGVQGVIVGGIGSAVVYTACDANGLGLETIVPLNCTAWLPDSASETFELAGVQLVDYWRV
jgi:nicotinamidase-related amidase